MGVIENALSNDKLSTRRLDEVLLDLLDHNDAGRITGYPIQMVQDTKGKNNGFVLVVQCATEICSELEKKGKKKKRETKVEEENGDKTEELETPNDEEKPITDKQIDNDKKNKEIDDTIVQQQNELKEGISSKQGEETSSDLKETDTNAGEKKDEMSKKNDKQKNKKKFEDDWMKKIPKKKFLPIKKGKLNKTKSMERDLKNKDESEEKYPEDKVKDENMKTKLEKINSIKEEILKGNVSETAREKQVDSQIENPQQINLHVKEKGIGIEQNEIDNVSTEDKTVPDSQGKKQLLEYGKTEEISPNNTEKKNEQLLDIEPAESTVSKQNELPTDTELLLKTDNTTEPQDDVTEPAELTKVRETEDKRLKEDQTSNQDEITGPSSDPKPVQHLSTTEVRSDIQENNVEEEDVIKTQELNDQHERANGMEEDHFERSNNKGRDHSEGTRYDHSENTESKKDEELNHEHDDKNNETREQQDDLEDGRDDENKDQLEDFTDDQQQYINKGKTFMARKCRRRRMRRMQSAEVEELDTLEILNRIRAKTKRLLDKQSRLIGNY